MSRITDYDTLQDTIVQVLMRPDLEPQVPLFIQLAEAQFDRVLRTKEMMERAQAEADEQYIPLPPDWLEARNVQRVADGYKLEYMTLEELDEYRWKLRTGEIVDTDGPKYFSYMGDTMELAPSPASPTLIEIAYFRALVKLSDENPVNWLITEHPDLYLYAALVHTAPYLKDDERIAVWQQFRDNAIMELNGAERHARRSGAALTRRFTNRIG